MPGGAQQSQDPLCAPRATRAVWGAWSVLPMAAGGSMTGDRRPRRRCAVRRVGKHWGRFNTESITKLFTAEYYLIQVDGAPGPSLGDDLRSLIQESNNTVQIDLWQSGILPVIADRYGLTGSSNSAAEARHLGIGPVPGQSPVRGVRGS